MALMASNKSFVDKLVTEARLIRVGKVPDIASESFANDCSVCKKRSWFRYGTVSIPLFNYDNNVVQLSGCPYLLVRGYYDTRTNLLGINGEGFDAFIEHIGLKGTDAISDDIYDDMINSVTWVPANESKGVTNARNMAFDSELLPKGKVVEGNFLVSIALGPSLVFRIHCQDVTDSKMIGYADMIEAIETVGTQLSDVPLGISDEGLAIL